MSTEEDAVLWTLEENGEFMFISQVVARPWRPLRIYSTYGTPNSLGVVVLFQAQVNHTDRENKPEFNLNGLNTAGVKTP